MTWNCQRRNLRLNWKSTMTKEEMLEALARAANYCSDIYYEARNSGNKELEDLMSATDTCIMEAIDMVERL